MLRGFSASPARVNTCSPHVRAFKLSRALRRLCLLGRGLVSVGASCCGAVLPLSAPTCSGPCAVVWNTCTRHFCYHLLLSVHVQTALCTSSAASGRCSRISPSRGLVEDLVLLCALAVGPSATRARDSFVLSQRGSDVFLMSPSLHCDCRLVDGAETTNVVPPSNQTRPSTPVTVAVGVRWGIYQRPVKNIARSSDMDRPVEWQSWQEGCTDIQCVTGQT